MFKNRSAALLGWLVLVTASVVRGQTPPPANQSTAPGLIKLTGADTGQNRLQKLNEGRLVSRMRESGLRGIFKETQRFWF